MKDWATEHSQLGTRLFKQGLKGNDTFFCIFTVHMENIMLRYQVEVTSYAGSIIKHSG